MKRRKSAFVRRFMTLAVAGILTMALAACTGRGGGYLPPQSPLFTDQASFGFDFSCERSSRSTSANPPTGQLRIQLAYTDHGSNPIGSSFGIHGTVDTIDPVLESAICIGQNPPPGGNELIFLGRYRLTSGSPSMITSACPTQETPTWPLCRFEVVVHDNDQNLAPSPGDFFSIKLSGSTVVDDELSVGTVVYARAGYLAGGNLTVG